MIHPLTQVVLSSLLKLMGDKPKWISVLKEK
jgi:hypothetical protein